jgi:hypothetical protein
MLDLLVLFSSHLSSFGNAGTGMSLGRFINHTTLSLKYQEKWKVDRNFCIIIVEGN